MILTSKKEFGDFQTPLPLASQICALLERRGIGGDFIVEPTCGVGAFLLAAAKYFPKARLLGWDINQDYVNQAKADLQTAGASERSRVITQDFFKFNWSAELELIKGRILVIGNLPWVTNATVSSVNGANIPAKENIHRHRGIAARTGKSNFDISEWMLIELLKSFRSRPAVIAMLCKTTVARKILRFGWQNDGRIAQAAIYRIDAQKSFTAAVDACLLIIETGSHGTPQAPIYDCLEAPTPGKILGMAGRDLVSNLPLYQKLRHLEGLCPYQWRSGVKHDCAPIVELRRYNTASFTNKLNEVVNLESDVVFPLLKCSDLANERLAPQHYLLLTQSRVGEDTAEIAARAPLTWDYLNSHKSRFEGRKSSIYNKRMPFAFFGIGDYSFAPWKVAVSGLHKTPRFVFVGGFEGKPILFDDTCYFLSFQSREEAEVVANILNSDVCRQFISSILFNDSKRPITVELLQRLNLEAIAHDSGWAVEWQRARKRNRESIDPRMQADFFRESCSAPQSPKRGRK